MRDTAKICDVLMIYGSGDGYTFCGVDSTQFLVDSKDIFFYLMWNYMLQ